MNLARRVAKLETVTGKKSRRFRVRFENQEADYTKVFVVRIVKPVVHDRP